jgi:predicted MFS family arabinose efflux permease
VIVSAVGAGTAFLLNGVSFLAVVFSLLAVRAAQQQKPKSDGDKRDNGFGAVIRFARAEPRVQDLLIFIAIVTFLAMSVVINLLAGFADTVLGGDVDTYGLLHAASGAGALIGVLFVAPLVQTSKRIGLMLVRVIIWMGVWFVVLAQTTSLPIAMLALAGAGIGGPSVVATAVGLLQVISPSEMRARMMSLFSMLSFGMQPIASVLVGVSGDLFGVASAVRLNGVLLILSVVAMVLFRPSLRTWEQNLPEKPKVMAEELFEPAA